MKYWGVDSPEQPETPRVAKGSEEKQPKLTVESVDNHIYFYAHVDTDRTLAMLKSIREIDTKLRNEYISRSLPEDMPLTPIWLHVLSGGGDLIAGFSTADQLETIATPIYSVVEGYCASAATLISVACTKRFILPNAFMLIHQLSSVMWGKYEEFKDEMHFLDMAMERLVGFYSVKTKMDETTVRALLQRDSWYNAKECVELGLVDEILISGRKRNE